MTITRRSILQGAAKAALVAPVVAGATALPLSSSPAAAIAAPEVSTWLPEGWTMTSFSLVDRLNPLSGRMADGTFRTATDEELRAHLDREPGMMNQADSGRVRELFPDGDGELHALFSARLELKREHYAASEGSPERETAEQRLAENLDAICDTMAVTRWGAAKQLCFMRDAIDCGLEDLSKQQQHRLLWSAIYVLQAEFGEMRDTGIPAKSVTAVVVKKPRSWPEIEERR